MSGIQFKSYIEGRLECARDLLSAVKEDLEVELALAFHKHPDEHTSSHELYGLLREEFEEFWELVKSDHSCAGMYQTELLHIAVVALRGWSMYQAKREGANG